jgi:putative transposase
MVREANPEQLPARQLRARRPSQLWVSDITHLATWRGVVYVAFVIDVFARCVIGWRV